MFIPKNILSSILIMASVILTQDVYAQLANNIWYFGEQAGIDFSSGTPT
jgi:hypothetical protein